MRSLWRFNFDGCRSSINRPLLSCWRDGDSWGIGLAWGNGNSDPIWLIEYQGGPRAR